MMQGSQLDIVLAGYYGYTINFSIAPNPTVAEGNSYT